MRKWGLALALTLGLPLGGCVETRQYRRRPVHAADGRLQIAGAEARRHGRIDHHRRHGRAARRLDRAGARQHRRSASKAAGRARRAHARHPAPQRACPESPSRSWPTSSGSTRRSTNRSSSTNISATICPPSAGRGLDWTVGQDAVRLGQKTGYDYALFLHAEDQVASTGRIVLGVLGAAGCIVGFCAPNIGGATQLDYASLVDLKTGQVVWFNVVRAGSQVPGIKFGDLRTPQGATRWSSGCSGG